MMKVQNLNWTSVWSMQNEIDFHIYERERVLKMRWRLAVVNKLNIW